MSFDAARAFNRRCPPGALVEVTLRGGETRTGRTRGPAIVWAGYALVEVEGWPGYWTVEAVRAKPAGASPAERPSGLADKFVPRSCEPPVPGAAAARSAEPAAQTCAE